VAENRENNKKKEMGKLWHGSVLEYYALMIWRLFWVMGKYLQNAPPPFSVLLFLTLWIYKE
jgi:hypothetical protein